MSASQRLIYLQIPNEPVKSEAGSKAEPAIIKAAALVFLGAIYMVSGFLGNSHISSPFGQAVSSPSLEVVSGGAAENERVPRELWGKGEASYEREEASPLVPDGSVREKLVLGDPTPHRIAQSEEG